MQISIGTFNLNNLFSRYNFSAQIDGAPDDTGGLTLEFDDQKNIKVRTFMGRLVKGKDEGETQEIAARIKSMNVDVLAVQEVEHIEILKSFNKGYLSGLYDHIALIEGNDQRLIDVGILSKFPIGSITSHQTAVHPDAPEKRVFGRDLLSIEILNESRSKKLFTLYNTHLKSHFVPYGQDPVEGALKANTRRQQQADMVAQIIGKEQRPNSKYILLGDMNDAPDSEFLQPMFTIEGRTLFNALQSPEETRPPKLETEGPGPQTTAWTYRHNPSGPTPPEFKLIDQIWLSDALKGSFVSSHIDRRTKHGGDGGDHDPAWVVLEINE